MLKEAVLGAMLAAAPVGAMGAESGSGKGIDGAKQDADVAVMCNDLAWETRSELEEFFKAVDSDDASVLDDQETAFVDHVGYGLEASCLKRVGDLVKKEAEVANDENSVFSPGFVRMLIALAVGLALAKLGGLSFRRKGAKGTKEES